MKPSAFLDDVSERLQAAFEANKRVMGFDEYLGLYLQNPRRHARNAAQYLLDCFDHYGVTELSTPLGERRRWNLFDAPWDDGRDRLVGQEEVQESLYRTVQNFVRQRRVNKLILLHGPNGSSKSSILGCLARAQENYSTLPDGALYCFNWVFPTRTVSRKRLGFGGAGGYEAEPDTYATLETEDVAATIPGDLRDHPLLLLPKPERQRLLELAQRDDPNWRPPVHLLEGELSPRNQQIAERLYAANGGDLRRVLRHVQVQRFYLSRRFRRGIVTVEPQLHVDASVRQLTGDRSLNTLPPILHSTTLYEPFGDLVDAHRGMIEYSDLLKRPLDSFKYLLSTCEKSSVSLPNQILFLDLIFAASSNETHLGAFKEYADWPSFKARIELVRVPYLRNYEREQEIYATQVTGEVLHTHVAPHASFVAALWSVLTRLRKPRPDLYPKELRGTIAGLTPLQKAELYATGRVPSGTNIEKARLLRAHLDQMAAEEREGVYEGRIGASPREMKLIMLNAAQRPEFSCLSPLAVLREIEELCTQTSVYPFLQMEPEGQYGDHAAFVGVVRERWLDIVDDELTRAMGLVTRDQYDDLFRRYLTHVSHAGRGEKMLNPVTGQFDEPDGAFMDEMEKHFQIEKDPDAFRSNVLGRIGAASQAGPVEPAQYRELFPDLFEALEGSYYSEQRDAIRKNANDLLRLLTDDGAASLSSGDRRRAEKTRDRLVEDFGYEASSIRELASSLVSERYS